MLSMCGVHQGPLYSIGTSTVIQPYLHWFENPAARELFEFQETTSAVSQAYQHALTMVLENGVRVVLLSSLNDQVVGPTCPLLCEDCAYIRSQSMARRSVLPVTHCYSGLSLLMVLRIRHPTS
jgi:hypothetical protein